MMRAMKKRKRVEIALALAAMLGLVLAVAAGCAGAGRGPAKIELSVAEFDFGTIPNSGPVSRVFRVRNTGQQTLEIDGVSTSCGCTTAEVDNTRLLPGEAANLTVTYDPQVHGGETGEFLRVVYVRSNDPGTPEASLTIRVSVAEPGG